MRIKPRAQIDWANWEPICVSDGPCAAEKRLLLGVLERAIRDALGIKGVFPPEWEKHYHAEARGWMGLGEAYRQPDHCEEWSFHWVCSHLRINAEYIHNQLSAALADPDAGNALRDQLYCNTLNRSFRRYEGPDRMTGKKTATYKK